MAPDANSGINIRISPWSTAHHLKPQRLIGSSFTTGNRHSAELRTAPVPHSFLTKQPAPSRYFTAPTTTEPVIPRLFGCWKQVPSDGSVIGSIRWFSHFRSCSTQLSARIDSAACYSRPLQTHLFFFFTLLPA